MVTTALTGKTRYRVQENGLFSKQMFIVLQVEEHRKGTSTFCSHDPYMVDFDTVEIDERNWRDAKVEDLLELDGMKGI